MTGITIAINIPKMTKNYNSSVSENQEFAETKFSSLHKKCIYPLSNEPYKSFVGKYWNCIRKNMKQSIQKKKSTPQNDIERQNLCKWTMEHQFLFTD